jgi:hypothetical protein
MDATGFLAEGSPSAWSVYVRVDDVDSTLERVTALGGRVVQPAMDTPYGRLAQAAPAAPCSSSSQATDVANRGPPAQASPDGYPGFGMTARFEKTPGARKP